MKPFVKGNILSGVAHKTRNIIIQEIQKGTERKRCYIIGSGSSLSVDEKDRIIKRDPIMNSSQPRIGKNDTVYAFYYTFECSGLEESSREIACFVNTLFDVYDSIILVGQSKCGLCLYNASHYCKREVTLVTISTPFHGTFMADKNAVESRLKSFILLKLYNIIFCDHNVDKDIVPDSEFIKNLQQAIYKKHINITSSLLSLSSCKDATDVFLFFWNKFMHVDGDGIVPITSQEINCTRTINISCSHANSLQKGLDIIVKL